MSTARVDPHHPAALVPADYAFNGIFYQGTTPQFLHAYAAANHEHALYLASHPRFSGNYVAKNACDICGVRFHHGAYFTHTPTGDVIHTGQDCAERLNLAAGTDMATIRGAINTASNQAAKKLAYASEREDFLKAHPGLEAALTIDHPDVRDIAAKFRTYRTLSPKQVWYVLKISERSAVAPPAKPQASRVAAGPDVKISGRVVSLKTTETKYGSLDQMLVADDRGFRVFGPAYSPDGTPPARGGRIEFTANVAAPAGDTPDFAYFSAPRSATETPNV